MHFAIYALKMVQILSMEPWTLHTLNVHKNGDVAEVA